MKRDDVSPPGWSGTTEAMKSHPEIDNPFALAWWEKEQGYESHKAGDDDDDAVTGVSAGAKPAPAESVQEPWEHTNELYENDDDTTAAEHSPAGMHGERRDTPMYDDDDDDDMMACDDDDDDRHAADDDDDDDDDDDKMMDDSEIAAGEHVPEEVAPYGDPAVTGGGSHTSGVQDPLPTDMGAHPLDIEGIEVNDKRMKHAR